MKRVGKVDKFGPTQRPMFAWLQEWVSDRQFRHVLQWVPRHMVIATQRFQSESTWPLDSLRSLAFDGPGTAYNLVHEWVARSTY